MNSRSGWTAFAVCLVAIMAGAFVVRVVRLEDRIFHGDEANQAVRAAQLWETGVYEYDRNEHHGPSLYWLTVPSLRLSGAKDLSETTEFCYRIVPVLFGVGLIALLPLVSDGLTRGGVVFAGLLTAISPAMVFYSRYYIQETLLVFFTFATIACGWRYFRSRSIGWAAAMGASIGMMHATKETWIIAAAAMVAGLAPLIAWAHWRTRNEHNDDPAKMTRLAACLWATAIIIVVVSVALLVAFAFYSSFGTNWKGPLDSILAYITYARRGSEAGIHSNPWWFYLKLLFAHHPAKGFFWTEGLIGGLAIVGAVAAFIPCGPCASGDKSSGGLPKPDLRVFCRFLAVYTIVLTILYSLIPYKTPWCMLSFLHGMVLLAGFGAWTLLCRLPGWPLRTIAAALLLAGVIHLGQESHQLNFRFHSDTRNPHVYAHSSSDVRNLAAAMERLADASPEGHEMVIHVVTPENYWPLPWCLRRISRIGYWQDASAWAEKTADYPPPSVILLTEEAQPGVDAHVPPTHKQRMTYGLRPEVFVLVYVRDDLWEAFQAKAASAKP